MREIKFRAWNKLDEEIKKVRIVHFGQHIVTDEKEPWELDMEQVELMQYTGLIDKNGKEIYEGDIVDSWANFDEKYIRTIIYDKEECRFKCSPSTGTMLCKVSTDNGTFEIIGNIYENPDLLNNK